VMMHLGHQEEEREREEKERKERDMRLLSGVSSLKSGDDNTKNDELLEMFKGGPFKVSEATRPGQNLKVIRDGKAGRRNTR